MSVYSDTEGSSEDIEVVGEVQQGLQPSHMEDDAPKGTVLPQALVDRIVDILLHVGYARPVVTPSVAPESRLSPTNELPSEGSSAVPGDAQYFAFRTVGVETLDCHPQGVAVRVSRESKAALFTVPSLSEPAVQRVRAEQGVAFKGVFQDPVRVDSGRRGHRPL